MLLNWIELNWIKVTVPVKISNRHYGFIETYKIREKFSLNQLERPVLLSFLVRCMKLRINTITTWNQKQYHIIQNWQNIGPKAYCKWTVFMKGKVSVSHNHFFIRNDLIYLNEISLFVKISEKVVAGYWKLSSRNMQDINNIGLGLKIRLVHTGHCIPYPSIQCKVCRNQKHLMTSF